MLPQERAEDDVQPVPFGRTWRAEDSTEPVLLFVHLPRTAGTTLNGILSRQYRGESFLKLSGGIEIQGGRVTIGANPLEGLATGQSDRLRAVSGHMGVGLDRMLSHPARYVTILRRPLDRVISLYRYAKATPTHPLHDRLTRGGLTLKDCLSRPTPQFNNGQLRLIMGLSGIHQLGHGVYDVALVEQARRILDERFSLVGVTERFDEFLVLAWQQFCWQVPLYRRSNVSADTHPDVDDETRALARAMNVMDDELYTYAVGRMERAIAEAGPAFHERLALFGLLNAAGGRT